jgi:hypothetical protein
MASLLLGQNRAEAAIAVALGLGLLSVVLISGRSRTNIVVDDAGAGLGRLFPPFFLSLGAMAALGVADRIVLERLRHPDAFAAYVYMVTILATPFALLSSYFGFKDAVRYRREFCREALRSDLLRALATSAVLVLAWSLACYLTRSLSGVTYDASLWGILGGLSIIRCGYGVLSAAMAVRAGAFGMYAVNAVTAVALVAYAAWAIRTDASMVGVVGGYMAVWSIRGAAAFACVGVYGGVAKVGQRNAGSASF